MYIILQIASEVIHYKVMNIHIIQSDIYVDLEIISMKILYKIYSSFFFFSHYIKSFYL